ncbi:hypothetical protein SPRG_11250 [Saprolegnia parasitica CBS 223.65]|uniref:Uncharacterized protein n=1 Tax=Saprolegnia parasitica (strain CBS 223.65) TaxID=695850 RepID=A0A067BZX3_SAPPC|nr:hypothetical protein SPRG_11250 [Saprolegnia parasitica CBS 223.65]KDO23818.1 hypothetical protein SPRG_11250 [Saprolegnia parasitica CBS 223.65]|eukprot:XP_012205451.1 hypothetical protein SPRG_11250 [Saprolegnia parasitica CBS 223.65]
MPERALPSLRRRSYHLHPVSPSAPPPKASRHRKPDFRRDVAASALPVPTDDAHFRMHIPREGSNRSINDMIMLDDDLCMEPPRDHFLATPRVPEELQVLKSIQSRVDSAMQSYDEAMNRPVIEYDNNPDEYMPVTWKVGEILMATHEAMTMMSGFSERPYMHDLDEARVLMSRDANDVVGELANECAPGIRRIKNVFQQTISLLQSMRASPNAPSKHSAFSEDLHKLIDRLQNEKAILLGQLNETASMYTSVTDTIKAKDDEVKGIADSLQAKTEELAKLRQELFIKQSEVTKKLENDKAAAQWKDKYMALSKQHQALELREKDTSANLVKTQQALRGATETSLLIQKELDDVQAQRVLEKSAMRELQAQLSERPSRPSASNPGVCADMATEYEYEIKELKAKVSALKDELHQSQLDHKAALERQQKEFRNHFELQKGEHGFSTAHDEIDTSRLFLTQPRVLVLEPPRPETAEFALAALQEIDDDDADDNDENAIELDDTSSLATLEESSPRRSVLLNRRRTALASQKTHIETQVDGFINEVFVAPATTPHALPEIQPVATEASDDMLRNLSTVSGLSIVTELQMQLEMDKQRAQKQYVEALAQFRTDMAARYEETTANLVGRHKLETQQMAATIQAKYHSLVEEKDAQLAKAQAALRLFYKSINTSSASTYEPDERRRSALQYQRTLKAVARSSYLMLATQNEETQRQHHNDIQALCDEIKTIHLEDLLPTVVEVPVVVTPVVTSVAVDVAPPPAAAPVPDAKLVPRTLMARPSVAERPMTPPPIEYAPPSMRDGHTQVSERDWMEPTAIEAPPHTTLPHYVLEGASVMPLVAPEDELLASVGRRFGAEMPALCLNQVQQPTLGLSKHRVHELVHGYATTLADIKARINWNKWQCVLKCLGLKRMEDVLSLEMHTSHSVEHALVQLRKRSVSKRAGFSDTHRALRCEQKRAWNACMDTLVTYSTATEGVRDGLETPQSSAIQDTERRPPTAMLQVVIRPPTLDRPATETTVTPRGVPSRARKLQVQLENVVRGVPSQSPFMRRKALESIERSMLQRRQVFAETNASVDQTLRHTRPPFART